jgi:hypothetical protein
MCGAHYLLVPTGTHTHEQSVLSPKGDRSISRRIVCPYKYVHEYGSVDAAALQDKGLFVGASFSEVRDQVKCDMCTDQCS